MRNFIQCLALVSSMIIVGSGRPAVADLMLNFSTNNGGDFSNSFDAQVGSTLNIGVYLQQSAPDTVLTTDGLVSWGFDLTRTSVETGSLLFLAPNAAFDIENHKVTSSNGLQLEYAQNSGLGVNGNSILLGSLQFNAVAEGTSLFTINDRLIGSGLANASWNTPGLNNLDEQIFGNGAAGTHQFSVNVTAVPEPGTFILLSVGVCLMLVLCKLSRGNGMASRIVQPSAKTHSPFAHANNIFACALLTQIAMRRIRKEAGFSCFPFHFNSYPRKPNAIFDGQFGRCR